MENYKTDERSIKNSGMKIDSGRQLRSRSIPSAAVGEPRRVSSEQDTYPSSKAMYNTSVKNSVCSVSSLCPRPDFLSAPVSVTHLCAPQGTTGCDAVLAVSYDCGMTEAPKARQGLGQGIAVGTVETPLQNIQNVSKSRNQLPAENASVDNFSTDSSCLDDDELDLLEQELKFRRMRLEQRKRNRCTHRYARPVGSTTCDTVPSRYVTPDKVDVRDNLAQLVQNLSLPKVDVECFDGSPLNFHHFMRNFEVNVADRLSDDSQRLNYLINLCKGSVKEAIRPCVMLPSDKGYKEALDILRRCYGKTHDIVQAAISSLFNIPCLSHGDVEGLKVLSTQMRRCLFTLEQIGRASDVDCTAYLVRIIEKLPRQLQERWAEVADSIISVDKEPTFRELMEFIEKRTSVASNLYGQLALRHVNPGLNVRPRSTMMALQQSTCLKCVECGKDHNLQECQNFLDKSVTGRMDTVKKNKICFMCLRANHLAKDCRKQNRCSEFGCGRRHHPLLHPVNANQPLASTDSRCGASFARTPVYLGCVPVRVVGPSGTATTYAFVDNGSDTTLIRHDLAHSLGLKNTPCQLSINTVTGKKVMQSSRASLQVLPLYSKDVVIIDCAYTVPTLPITSADDSPRIDVRKWPHLEGVELHSLVDRTVGILIGCDIPEAHVISEQRIGVGKQPHAVKSVFGWVLRGPCDGRITATRLINYTGAEEASLVETLQRFFELEFKDSGSEDKAPSLDDREATEAVERSIVLKGNKFIVGLPWRVGRNFMSNYKAVRHRLELLKKRLSKDSHLHSLYNTVMEGHLSKSYVSRVHGDDIKDRWFIPHHPVFNPNKPGKIRVVFDCAATFRGTSLNKSLLSGPDVANDLTGVLMRFRKYPIAICADIQEMFLQVGVLDKDKRYLSFLWWPDGNLDLEPAVHQLNVHPFGATSSPFCATFALRKTAQVFSHAFSENCRSTVLHNFYVDDCLVSTSTVTEAIRLVEELRRMLSLGGFKLAKWNSNRPEVLSNLPTEDRCISSCDDFSFESNQSTLGMRWDVDTDCFEIKVHLPDTPVTRRGILTCVASVFDPLGFTAPVTLRARQLLQELCKCHLGWDSPISEEFAKRWRRWLSDVQSIAGLRIPRPLGLIGSDKVTLELHTFSDASDTGYSAVSYLRVTNGAKTHCVFVMGKSRVAPKKIATLPRMELVAAVLASKLMRHVRKEIHLSVSRVVMWSDSTIVLHYLNNTTRRFTTFVANRINTIRGLTKGQQWRHVPTHFNPADVGSRGSASAKSHEMEMWLHGPKFLSQLETDWPSERFDIPSDLGDLDETKVLTVVTLPAWHKELFRRFSCWIKLLKSVAWLIRYKNYLMVMKGGRTAGGIHLSNLRPKELREAKLSIVRLVQEECFGSPIRPDVADRIKRLNPRNIDGIWHLGGRVQGSGATAVHPMLLPSHHPVVDLIIRYYHEINGHVGAVQVLSLLREQFWILKGMARIKTLLTKCPKCRLLYSKTLGQIMAPLPLERTSPGGYPFRYTGIDYFGPFKVRCGRSENKRYGCLFTCFQTRAVHVEVSQAMTTDSFLMALIRFCNRRGTPEIIFSDNGTNFVGAEAELRDFIHQLEDGKIENRMLVRGIEWRFNPPGASHRGGIWERIIRSIRRILSAVMVEQVMSEEVLLTSLSEVERILNERPLTPLYDDPDSCNVLRPVDLLLLKVVPLVNGTEISLADSYKKGWRQAQVLANTFWRRWIAEYLPTLQARSKWTQRVRDIQVGDVVLIADPSLSRGAWKKGLIVRVMSSSDDHPRTAEVRTTDGLKQKDIRSLCLLEGVDE